MLKISYRQGYKYQLVHNHTVVLDFVPQIELNTPFLSFMMTGVMHFKWGYAWDGPSGPAMDTKSAMRGSLYHDGLYQLMREGRLPLTYRPYADSLYKQTCLEDGMWQLRALYHMKGVRWFAASAAHPDNLKPILTAP